MRRLLGLFLVLGLLFGAAACGSSDDGGGDDTPTTEADNGSDSGDSGDSGNADVKAYCDAVDDYVKKAEAAIDDPSKASDLAAEGQELADKAADLATADLSADEAQEVADCTQKSTDALTPG